MMIKNCIIYILIIALLIIALPVGAFAEPVIDYSSLVSAGNLAVDLYAQAVGYDVAASAADLSYNLTSAAQYIYDGAVASSDYVAHLTEIVNLYPEASAAAASAAGVSSLTSITTSSELAAAAGSCATVTAGTVALSVLGAALVGAAVYYVLANAVTIPDYGVTSYRRFGDLVAPVVTTGSFYASTDGVNYNRKVYSLGSSLPYSGTSLISSDFPYEFQLNNYTYTINNSVTSYNSDFSLKRGSNAVSPSWSFNLEDYTRPGGSYQPKVRWDDIGTPINPCRIVYVDTASYVGLSMVAVDSNGNYSWYTEISSGTPQLQAAINYNVSSPDPGTDLINNTRWMRPASALNLPGYGNNPSIGLELTPIVGGAPAISSIDPDTALKELDVALVDAQISADNVFVPVVDFADLPSDDDDNPSLDVDAPLDTTDNTTPIDTDMEPTQKPTLPVIGLSVPWSYVTRLINDCIDGLQAFSTAWNSVVPFSFLNCFYAAIVLAILFGLLKRFLE